jgi:hypothetical protein
MRTLLFAAALLAITNTTLAQTAVPYSFAAGTPAKAGEVNANFQALVSAINDLSTRVSKLDGPLTMAALAGTYHFQGLQTELNGGTANQVRVYTYDGTLTLNANGTGNASVTQTGGQISISGSAQSLSVVRTVFQDPPEGNSFSWSLSGNTINGLGGSFYVVDQGRLMIRVDTNTADATSKVLLLIRTP